MIRVNPYFKACFIVFGNCTILALQDTAYYKHVLNGDGRQGTSKNFVLEGAWIKYANNGGYETLETKGPLRRNVYLRVRQSFI